MKGHGQTWQEYLQTIFQTRKHFSMPNAFKELQKANLGCKVSAKRWDSVTNSASRSSQNRRKLDCGPFLIDLNQYCVWHIYHSVYFRIHTGPITEKLISKNSLTIQNWTNMTSRPLEWMMNEYAPTISFAAYILHFLLKEAKMTGKPFWCCWHQGNWGLQDHGTIDGSKVTKFTLAYA